jgi:hypothetical protein
MGFAAASFSSNTFWTRIRSMSAVKSLWGRKKMAGGGKGCEEGEGEGQVWKGRNQQQKNKNEPKQPNKLP